MILHEDKSAFLDLIQETAKSIGLPEVYIEKDYWVTDALKNLSESEYVSKVVFKGGTSLSKAHNLIHRFSEDVDLAVIQNGISGNPLKTLLKNIEKQVTKNMKPVPNDKRESKGSKFRRSIYEYQRDVPENNFGDASPQLLVEINSFTTPEPFSVFKLRSLISTFLESIKRIDLIEKYQLNSFDINVLLVERTLVEKIIRLTKDSYLDNKVETLGKDIRHFYDISQILKHSKYRNFISANDDFYKLYNTCILTEKDNEMENANFLNHALSEAPLFLQLDDLEVSLEKFYKTAFSELIYGEKPSWTEVIGSFYFIKDNI